jgi:hypothetical protein
MRNFEQGCMFGNNGKVELLDFIENILRFGSSFTGND